MPPRTKSSCGIDGSEVGSYEARRHSACGQFLYESIAGFREATAAAEIDDLILQFGRLAFFLGFLQIDSNTIGRMFQIAGLNHQQPMCACRVVWDVRR